LVFDGLVGLGGVKSLRPANAANLEVPPPLRGANFIVGEAGEVVNAETREFLALVVILERRNVGHPSEKWRLKLSADLCFV
jgi:hypothetical protein